MIDILRGHWQYLSYVVIHKWYVFIECCNLGRKYNCLWSMIWRGLWHDASKFRPDEWFPYMAYFNGSWRKVPGNKDENCPDDIDDAFDEAWLSHLHRNKHHWQHYILNKDDGSVVLKDMPIIYVLEMIADWTGAGKMFGKDDVKSWYSKNWKKQTMSVVTRSSVDSILGA